jgi:hypothetical protein
VTDLSRIKEDESIFKVYGTNRSIDLCLVDGAENLKDHVETLRINVGDGDIVESLEINVPDAAGFLLLKTTVVYFRAQRQGTYCLCPASPRTFPQPFRNAPER